MTDKSAFWPDLSRNLPDFMIFNTTSTYIQHFWRAKTRKWSHTLLDLDLALRIHTITISETQSSVAGFLRELRVGLAWHILMISWDFLESNAGVCLTGRLHPSFLFNITAVHGKEVGTFKLKESKVPDFLPLCNLMVIKVYAWMLVLIYVPWTEDNFWNR